MNERDWGKRDWGSEDYLQSMEEARQTEQMIRQILALVAQGSLVYRRRERSAPRVSTKTDRLKRMRAVTLRVAS